MLTWQVFAHSGGECAVPATDEPTARAILARNAHDKRDPGWPHAGTMTRERPPWSDWERLEAWATKEKIAAPGEGHGG